jgi:hypothetical protein
MGFCGEGAGVLRRRNCAWPLTDNACGASNGVAHSAGEAASPPPPFAPVAESPPPGATPPACFRREVCLCTSSAEKLFGRPGSTELDKAERCATPRLYARA